MHISTIFLVGLILWYTGLVNPKKQKIFDVMKFSSCSEYPDLPILLSLNRKRVYGKNNKTLELTFLVKREIGGKLEGNMSVWKCGSSGAPDSCEYFVKDLKVKKLCEKIPMKNQMWTLLVEGFDPPLDCPIKAHSYEVKAPYQEEILKYLPVPGGVWKAKGFMYSDDQTVVCIDFEGKIVERSV
ncbi:hypothetical protein HHI36_008533 [Cryptolaemus montrouzieri]|uniref:MD-2-related lipid-recognition domain-containing protein n=1 Tax=Cryptolaemus montrouzieri TaxID=559131 RepID=A0ABD2MTJ1_9CUCU